MTLRIWIVLLIMMVGVPVVSNLNFLMPYSYNLWYKIDLRYFNVFWVSVIIIQLFSLFVTIKFIQVQLFPFSDFGFYLTFKQTIRLLGLVIVIYLFFLGLAELLFQKITMSCFVPDSTSRRAVYCFSLISAGISEEFIFRAFSLKLLNNLKVPAVLSILITSLAFALNHGIGAMHNFTQYLIFGILMAVIFLWKRNILYCMGVHIAYNFFTLFYCFT